MSLGDATYENSHIMSLGDTTYENSHIMSLGGTTYENSHIMSLGGSMQWRVLYCVTSRVMVRVRKL